MNRNQTNEELVGRYLDNEMSEIDKLAFENELLQDAGLREELNFQQEVIDGIKEARRHELKARLDNIPTASPFYQTLAFKSIVVASITAGIGLGVYFYTNQPEELTVSKIDITENIIEEHVSEIPAMPETITPEQTHESADVESVQEVITKPKKLETRPTVTADEGNKEVVAMKPNVIVPDVIEDPGTDDFETDQVTFNNQINNLDAIMENVESAVEVSTVKDKKNKFHYKFFDSKLYLLGSFGDMPYEIIELNSKTGKSYFLYYNDSYYKLDAGQVKPAPLVKIESDSIINELKIIQMNQK